MSASVALVNPKYSANVGNALRACSNFQAEALAWTPQRVPDPGFFLLPSLGTVEA